MAQLFSQGGRTNKPQAPATALRIQSALQGQPVSILLGGQNRIAGNLIDYVDFKAQAQSSGGGKGGIGGGGGKGQAGTSYNYSVAVIIALCEGPVSSVLQVWNQKTAQTLASLNLTAFLGAYTQSPWGYMATAHPDRALAYRGLAYVAAGPLALGNSPELPNLTFEVKGSLADAISGAPDADAKDCVIALLSNDKFGANFPPSLIGDLSLFSNYCRATGMVVSPVVSGQTSAQSFLKDFLEALNSEAVWSNGKLKIVPYGDERITANGADYNPDLTPQFDFTDDDFVENQGTGGSGNIGDPVVVTNVAHTDKKNWIQVEYLNRAASPDPETGESNAYNPALVDAKDDASINLFGPVPADKKTYHFFCLGSAAKMSASLLLGRQQVLGTRTFTVAPKFIQLDPMDIVTVSDLGIGFDRTPLRIKEITENNDYSLTMVCEDLLIGSAAAPHYGSQANSGNVPNYNADPGTLNTPIIFEPTDQLAGGLEIWLALSGMNTALWGGCLIYASTDGNSYAQVGKITGAARTGLLSAPLAAVPANPIGQTIDPANTLSVDLSQSKGELTSGSQQDALSLNTLCYVGGEYVAFQNANLTGANKYDLSYLVRGGYGTEAQIVAHSAGTIFARIDDSLAKIPFTQDRIGQTIFFKFASFNIYGGGQQSLDEVDAIPYTVRGTALSSPLPNVENPRTSFLSDRSWLDWDEISDFRPVRYEIRVGNSWSTAITLGSVAHPPFPLQGDGLYWIAAVSQPVAGLTVYSEDPVSIEVLGSLLTNFVIKEVDEQALGWPGIFTNAKKQGSFITTESGMDVFAPSDIFLPDDVFGGGGETTGYYEQPPENWIDAKFPQPILLGAAWTGTGSPPDQNILTVDDFLNMADVLGSASTQFVSVWLEVALAQDGGPSPTWGQWQKFSPGEYVGETVKFRMGLRTVDGSRALPFGLAMKITASVRARVDHVMGLDLDPAGTTINFKPDGSVTAVPFNGGPNGSSLPFPQVAIRDAQQGDTVKVSDLSVSSCKVQVLNGGVGVERIVDVIITGW